MHRFYSISCTKKIKYNWLITNASKLASTDFENPYYIVDTGFVMTISRDITHIPKKDFCVTYFCNLIQNFIKSKISFFGILCNVTQFICLIYIVTLKVTVTHKNNYYIVDMYAKHVRNVCQVKPHVWRSNFSKNCKIKFIS